MIDGATTKTFFLAAAANAAQLLAAPSGDETSASNDPMPRNDVYSTQDMRALRSKCLGDRDNIDCYNAQTDSNKLKVKAIGAVAAVGVAALVIYCAIDACKKKCSANEESNNNSVDPAPSADVELGTNPSQ